MNEPCVLLVDAEELVRTPLAQYLRECGYRVLEAIGAEEAQRLLSGVLKSSTSCLRTSKRLGMADLLSQPGCGKIDPRSGFFRPEPLQLRRAGLVIYVRKSRRYESHMTTNSCWIVFAASLPNVTETEIEG